MKCCRNNTYSKSESPFELLDKPFDFYDGVTECLMACKHCSSVFYFRIAEQDFLTEWIRFFYFTKLEGQDKLNVKSSSKDYRYYRKLPVTHLAIFSSSFDCLYFWSDISLIDNRGKMETGVNLIRDNFN